MAWQPPVAAGVPVPLSWFTAISNQFATWQGAVNANNNPVTGIASSVAASVTYGPQALAISSPIISSGVTVGNIYGLYIAGQQVTGVTNGFGLYQAGFTDQNQFNGLTTFARQVTFSGGISGITVSLTEGSGVTVYAPAITVSTPTLASGATITNAYGLVIGQQKITGVTNGWGVYQGGTDPNLFSGSVGIGTATPTSPLQVVGLPTYASDAAAGGGGLTTGAFYKDSSGGLHVKL